MLRIAEEHVEYTFPHFSGIISCLKDGMGTIAGKFHDIEFTCNAESCTVNGVKYQHAFVRKTHEITVNGRTYTWSSLTNPNYDEDHDFENDHNEYADGDDMPDNYTIDFTIGSETLYCFPECIYYYPNGKNKHTCVEVVYNHYSRKLKANLHAGDNDEHYTVFFGTDEEEPRCLAFKNRNIKYMVYNNQIEAFVHERLGVSEITTS
jgi:hypothetical protein